MDSFNGNNRRTAMTRRQALATSAATISLGFRPADDVVWRPRTLCGVNIAYSDFWDRPLNPGQREVFEKIQISFIRALYFAYTLGRYKPQQLDASVHSITAFECDEVGTSKLRIYCKGYLYAVPINDYIVISEPIYYNDTVLITNRAYKVIGSRAGSVDSTGNFDTQSFVVIDANAPIPQEKVVLTSNAKILHRNFYTSGSKLRRPISQYFDRISEWLGTNFHFIYGGWHDNWFDLINLFGRDNIQIIRQQEWNHVAGLDWDYRKVLIADENEAVWPGRSSLERWTAFKPYLKDVLVPEMRTYFPKNTIAIGFPYWANSPPLDAIDWWPTDRNIVLRIHDYMRPSKGGVLPLDGLSKKEIAKHLDYISQQVKRLNISGVIYEEFGNPLGIADRSLRLKNFREMVQDRGWPCASWDASQYDSFATMHLDDKGLWQPLSDAAGAFGAP